MLERLVEKNAKEVMAHERLAIGCDALRVTKRAVERRANREAWHFEEESVRGGQRKVFELDSLPGNQRSPHRQQTSSHDRKGGVIASLETNAGRPGS